MNSAGRMLLAYTPPTVPAAPTGVSTSNVGQTSMRVSWAHTGTNVDGFIVEGKMNYTGFEYVQLAQLPSDARMYDATCLRPAATPYLFRVSAYNTAGRGSAVTPSNTLTLQPTTVPAVAPMNFHATPVSANSYRIEWDHACSTADRILVEVSVNNGAYASVLAGQGDYFMSDATWFLYTDIPPGITYRFRASRGNSVGFTATTAPIVVGPLSAPPGSASSFGVYADYDNMKVLSDLLPSLTNTVYQSGQLNVGCFWLYNTFLGMQNFNCYSAAIHFPLSGTTTSGAAFNLAGRTIDRAILLLNTSSIAVHPTQLYVSAIATPWNTATLSGGTLLNLYSGGSSVNQAPGIFGPWAVDVTAIVQNWVNGSAQNHGLLVEDANFVFPYADLIRVSTFSSTDTYANDMKNRPTLWIDSH